MDIFSILNNLVVARGKTRLKVSGDGLHKHHIKPKHLGGKDHPDNYTYLTRKEHKLVHKILYKLYNSRGDKVAVNYLSGKNCKVWNKGKKSKTSAWNKGLTSPNKGKTYEEIYSLEKASDLKRHRSKTTRNMNLNKSQETKERQRQSIIKFYENNISTLKGKKKSKESVEKTSSKNRGQKRSKEFGEKRSEYMKNNQNTKGWKWITNGIDNKLISPRDQIPNEWKFGRTITKKF